jgi:hypothetical protein
MQSRPPGMPSLEPSGFRYANDFNSQSQSNKNIEVTPLFPEPSQHPRNLFQRNVFNSDYPSFNNEVGQKTNGEISPNPFNLSLFSRNDDFLLG